VAMLSEVARDEALRGRLTTAATTFVGGNDAALDPAWYGAAFASYLTAGKLEAGKALLERALASQDPVMRPAALGALGDSDDPSIARWLLDEVKDTRLRTSERLNLVRGIIAAQGTREFGYDWMTRHLDELLGGGGGIFFAAKLPQALAGWCSAEQAARFARDLRPRFKGKTGELELERTIERVRSCGLLKQARGAEASRVVAALK
jgi:hypothetical protein